MPERRDDGTFVYTSLRQAVNYAQMGGFDVEQDKTGAYFASRADMPTYFELVEEPGTKFLNYTWQRVRVRGYR